MRVMTDARRQAILETATQVFREVGYERASMAMISARLGGSKATLYKYFPSKEELFAAAMLAAMETRGQELVRLLDADDEDLSGVLRRFGLAYLDLVCTGDALAITRTAVGYGAHSSLGARLYANGPRRGLVDIASYLEKLQRRGRLREDDPHLVAAHLKALLEAGVLEPLLFGARGEFALATVVEQGVAAFLRAYATPQSADGS